MRYHRIWALLLSVMTGAVAPVVGAESTVVAAEQQLASAVAELASVREKIATEKLPVAAELRRLETALLEKRRERERLQRMRDNSGVEISSLENALKLRNDEIAYVGNLFSDYANRLNASLHPAEVNAHSERLLGILDLSEKSDLARTARLQQQGEALLIGIQRLADLAGGHRFDGSAVLPDGRFEAGSFALVGPVGLFATKDGRVAGLAERGTAAGPRIVVFDDAATAAIAALAGKGSGPVPLDPTDGSAIALAATEETLVEHIMKGGIWMYPILGFAFLALFIGIFKFVEIASVKLPPPNLVDDVLTLMQAGQPIEAERVARQAPGPAAAMIADGVRHATLPKELLDELMFERILEVKPKLERGLALITVTAAVAPLLGLLGTVTGMINTFKAITVFGTGDAKSLSSGISEALITTEYGLIVAIPALLLGSFLSRRAGGVLATMERLSITFVNGVTVLREVGPGPTRAVEPVNAA